MMQIHLRLLPQKENKHHQFDPVKFVEVVISMAIQGTSPTREVGHLNMTVEEWDNFLITLLRGGDHIHSNMNVSIESNGHAIDLSNALVKRKWEKADDPWMFAVAQKSSEEIVNTKTHKRANRPDNLKNILKEDEDD